MDRKHPNNSRGWRLAALGAVAALCMGGTTGPATAQGGVVPSNGQLMLADTCDVTFGGRLLEECDCLLMVIGQGGTYVLSSVNLGCEGYAGMAGQFQGELGSTSGLQLAYERNYAQVQSSRMQVSASQAQLAAVASEAGWLLLRLELLGPTIFENSLGRICIDGGSGSQC